MTDEDEARACVNATKRVEVIKARAEVIDAAKKMAEAMSRGAPETAALVIKVVRAVDALKRLEEAL